MIGLDDVPCSIGFTMRELAEISFISARTVVELTRPEDLGKLQLSRTVADAIDHTRLLRGIVRKIEESISERGMQEIRSVGIRGAELDLVTGKLVRPRERVCPNTHSGQHIPGDQFSVCWYCRI